MIFIQFIEVKYPLSVGSEVLITMVIFLDITQYSPLEVNGRFGGAYLLHIQSRRLSRARNKRECRWKTVKNIVFWDVAPCGSGLNRRFGGTFRLHLQGSPQSPASCDLVLFTCPED
jgi:hypothetical protein